MLAIVGPTATGKTSLAVEVALAHGGEVVNADAMSLYRGMDVGTATPTTEERRGVPHHLFDLWDVRHAASVAEYQAASREVIREVQARGALPIVVGGSGLYVRAALDDLTFPGTDPQLRRLLEEELESLGPQAMHDRLAAMDPAAAAAILPSNGRRIVRALEVVTMTGRPYVAVLPEPRPFHRTCYVGLDEPAPALDARIEERVTEMWSAGLLDEVTRLDTQGLREGRTASRAVGYREALRHLDGEWEASRAMAETARATRRLSRRQRSWFRRDQRIRWLGGSGPERLREALSLAGNIIGP